MRILDAERVVNQYGAVLEEASHRYGTVYPVSMLPFTREEIKTAFKVYIAGLIALGKLTDTTRDVLKAGYVSLAAFIEDHKAYAVIAWEKWISKGAELGVEGLPKHLGSDPRSGEQALRIYEEISRETAVLGEEFVRLLRLTHR
jgi:hypothetical protein